MTISITDLSLVYSGGVGNSDPNESLGGDPSVTEIINGINNLFSNVPSEAAELGGVDYRAFYIFNDNLIDSLYSTKLWIESQVVGGASIRVGVNLIDEIQRLTIIPQNDITSGDFKIRISYSIGASDLIETTTAIDWDADFTILATNIETALNDLNKFSEVNVADISPDAIFEITFEGNDGNTLQPDLVIVDNTLISTGDAAAIDVSLITQGSPINTITEDIGEPTIPPTGILFTNPNSEGNSLEVGILTPTIGFPVWIKRTVNPVTEALDDDGYTLRLQGSSTE